MTDYRKKIMLQLGTECIKCGSNIGLELDHIIPIRLSNKNERARDLRHPNVGNMQILCYACHQIKTKSERSL